MCVASVWVNRMWTMMVGLWPPYFWRVRGNKPRLPTYLGLPSSVMPPLTKSATYYWAIAPTPPVGSCERTGIVMDYMAMSQNQFDFTGEQSKILARRYGYTGH